MYVPDFLNDQSVKVAEFADMISTKILPDITEIFNSLNDERNQLRDQVEQLRAHLAIVMEAGRKAFLAGNVTPESIAFIKAWSNAIPLIPENPNHAT
jgi:hypothetical protein